MEDNAWKDSDGNGVRDKDGTELSYTITYPAAGVYDDVVLFISRQCRILALK